MGKAADVSRLEKLVLILLAHVVYVLLCGCAAFIYSHIC